MKFIRTILLALATMLLASVDVYAQGCGAQNPNCIVPTASLGTSNSQAASTAFVQNASTALLGSPNTWADIQTFTLAPVFTNQSGSRTALGLGTFATQNYATPPIIGGTTPNVANFSTLGVGLVGTTLASQANTPSLLLIADGTTASPITAGNTPTIQISRIESIVNGTSSGDGSLGATLSVALQTNNTQQATAAKFVVTTLPSGAGTTNDNVAIYGVAVMSGNANQGHIGYAGYFAATSTTAGNAAVTIGTGVFNATGVDQVWGSGVTSAVLDAVAQGTNNLISAATVLRAAGGAQFDVGHGARAGSVKTAFLQDDSSSITILKATGAHTSGVDLSGATFSGGALKLPNNQTAYIAVGSFGHVIARQDIDGSLLIGGGQGDIIFNGANPIRISTIANNSVATAMSSVGPTGSHTTVQEWFPIKNAAGTIRYVPGF